VERGHRSRQRRPHLPPRSGALEPRTHDHPVDIHRLGRCRTGIETLDLAYAAHGFVPLSPDASIIDDVAGERLAALVEGYGLNTEVRIQLVNMLGERIRSMYQLLKDGYENGAHPWSRLWEEGHGTVWLADAVYVEDRYDVWAKALGIHHVPT